VAVFVAVWWHGQASESPFPKDIRQSVSFPLYYPQKLPPTFRLNQSSFSSTPQVVTYSFTYEGSKQLVVSIQPTAGGVDPNTFNPNDKFTTSIGTAYLVDMDDRTTAAVMGDKSWLLINAPQKISVDTLKQFINALR
jgi:hypothetical protein